MTTYICYLRGLFRKFLQFFLRVDHKSLYSRYHHQLQVGFRHLDKRPLSIPKLDEIYTGTRGKFKYNIVPAQ